MRQDGWRPPVIMTAALKAEGIDELADAFINHRRHLADRGKLVNRLFKQIVQGDRRRKDL